MSRAKKLVVIIATISLAVWGGYLYWRHDQPRRNAAQAISRLASALMNPNTAELLDTVLVPAAIHGRTPAEQLEFLTKALRDEISSEGLAVLRREGSYGTLEKLFPQEAAAWAGQAGVQPSDCVAFRLDRNGVRAEVVLVHEGQAYRVVRCNNVKQLAPEGRRS